MTTLDAVVADLCLAILDGVRQAAGVLADRFEELGDVKTARKVRRYNRNKKLAIILLALPDAACWELACDFAERVAGGNQALRQAITTRRQWLKGEATDRDLAAAEAAAWSEWRPERRDEDFEGSPFWARARAAVWTCASCSAHYAAVSTATQAAWAAGWGTPPTGWGKQRPDQTRWLGERRWQISRIREYLTGIKGKDDVVSSRAEQSAAPDRPRD
jgi:hypothetical protein